MVSSSLVRVGLVGLGLLASVASAKTPWHKLDGYSFDSYKAEFGKFYETAAESSSRRVLFETRLASIRLHNADASQTYRRGVNQLSDRTPDEMTKLKGADKTLLHTQRSTVGSSSSKPARPSNNPLPARVDWREHYPTIISPVKNQGSCGSCWAFASTESLESHWALATGKLEDLSPQFILDCTPNTKECGGTGGCMGGTADLAYTRLAQLGGLPSEWSYPYTSGTGVAGKCHGLPLAPEQPHTGAVLAAANVTGHVAVTSNDYDAVMAALANVGPLTITVDAGGWHDYEEGVFSGGNHSNPDLDHLVQLVGYGVDEAVRAVHGGDSGMYFLVRNSWTPSWGIDGYIKLARSPTPTCGTDINPADGDGCKGGPPTAKVCGQSGVLYDAVYPLVQ